MNRTYDTELKGLLRKKLRLYLLGAAVATLIGILLAVVVVVRCAVTIPVAVAMGLLTALLGTWVYCFAHYRILPLYCVDRLMRQVHQKQPESFEGIFRGFAEGKVMYDGVMMYKLRLDEGKRVGKEQVSRELSIPAAFGKPHLEEGMLIRGAEVESIVVASQYLPAKELRSTEGKYQISAVAVLAIIVGAAVLWGSIYNGIHKQTPEVTLNVAVCTPAHHEETQSELAEVMVIEGVNVAFSYTNTLDAEAVAMYLATFGSMDADLLVLNNNQFFGVFENDGYPLDRDFLVAELGVELRFVANTAGESTGIVLYDPEDPAYNAAFPKLIDWIAVEKDVALVAVIRYDSVNADNGRANLALVQLLTYLADK